jgi:D-serine deaminase-like pyridoxal phosphate-dependent protein
LLIDLERVDQNLHCMLEIAGGPDRLCPHVKTHKLGPLVQRQMELGITKFKCATIAEAEMVAIAERRRSCSPSLPQAQITPAFSASLASFQDEVFHDR